MPVDLANGFVAVRRKMTSLKPLVRAFPGPEAIVSFSSQRDRSSHGFCRHMRIHATNLPRAWQD